MTIGRCVWNLVFAHTIGTSYIRFGRCAYNNSGVAHTNRTLRTQFPTYCAYAAGVARAIRVQCGVAWHSIQDLFIQVGHFTFNLGFAHTSGVAHTTWVLHIQFWALRIQFGRCACNSSVAHTTQASRIQFVFSVYKIRALRIQFRCCAYNSGASFKNRAFPIQFLHCAYTSGVCACSTWSLRMQLRCCAYNSDIAHTTRVVAHTIPALRIHCRRCAQTMLSLCSPASLNYFFKTIPSLIPGTSVFPSFGELHTFSGLRLFKATL